MTKVTPAFARGGSISNKGSAKKEKDLTRLVRLRTLLLGHAFSAGDEEGAEEHAYDCADCYGASDAITSTSTIQTVDDLVLKAVELI